MKRIFALLLGVCVLTTSFGAFATKPASKTNLVVSEEKKAKVEQMYKDALADGNMTYDEIKAIATEAKGAKLSLKEKLALKVAKKQLNKNAAAGGSKSQLIALILCALVGTLGIHRFYLGYTWQGIVQLLTLGGCGIWSLIDLIRIITGDLGPKDGSYDKTL
jgi:TM2 domain-containing membrane protein YozV